MVWVGPNVWCLFLKGATTSFCIHGQWDKVQLKSYVFSQIYYKNIMLNFNQDGFMKNIHISMTGYFILSNKSKKMIDNCKVQGEIWTRWVEGMDDIQCVLHSQLGFDCCCARCIRSSYLGVRPGFSKGAFLPPLSSCIFTSFWPLIWCYLVYNWEYSLNLKHVWIRSHYVHPSSVFYRPGDSGQRSFQKCEIDIFCHCKPYAGPVGSRDPGH